MHARIVNVVATASLNQVLDFCQLKRYKEIYHNSNIYGGRLAYFGTQEMEGKISIFSSGKMISAGTKSEDQAFKELRIAMKFLVEKNIAKNVELDPKVHNLVLTADFEMNLNLENLSENLRAIYEPEQFPGAILRIEEPFRAPSILIFASGKTVIAGLKSQTQIEPTIKLLKRLIESNQ